MISAREDNIVLLKLGEGENMDSLLNVLEAYEINSGIIEGFGKLRTENSQGSMEVILKGVISKLKGRPHLDLYSFSKQTSKLRDFISEDLIFVVRKFDKIKLNSILDESGNIKLSIED